MSTCRASWVTAYLVHLYLDYVPNGTLVGWVAGLVGPPSPLPFPPRPTAAAPFLTVVVVAAPRCGCVRLCMCVLASLVEVLCI